MLPLLLVAFSKIKIISDLGADSFYTYDLTFVDKFILAPSNYFTNLELFILLAVFFRKFILLYDYLNLFNFK